MQDSSTGKIVMLGYMNAESLERTKQTRKVKFYSRSRQEIWVKGETSGFCLGFDDILIECDNDTLLIKATPSACFGEANASDNFLAERERIIPDRRNVRATTRTRRNCSPWALTRSLQRSAKRRSNW